MASRASIQSEGIAALCLGPCEICNSGLPRQQEVIHKGLPLGQVEGASRGRVLVRKQVRRRLAGSTEELPVQDLCGLAASFVTDAWLHAWRKQVSNVSCEAASPCVHTLTGQVCWLYAF